MLAAAERWGGGEDERPFLPRAFSVARVADDGQLEFMLEDVGPGHPPPRRAARRATACGCSARSASRSAAPRDGLPPVLVGGGVGTAPIVMLADALGDDALGAARLPRRRARRTAPS